MAKSRSKKSKRSMSPAQKKWHTHLMKVFKEGKRKNSDYSLRQAMKDARKTYHKSSREYKGSLKHKAKQFFGLSPKSPKAKRSSRKGSKKSKKRSY